MKSKVLFILIIILLIAVGAVWLSVHLLHLPQEKMVNDFLKAVAESEDYSKYLVESLGQHSFPTLLKRLKITHYDIERIQFMEKNRCKVWMSARFPAGRVPFSMNMVKLDRQWKISRLPDVGYYTHGIPIKLHEDEKREKIWHLLVGEKSLEISAPPEAKIQVGEPVQFITLDGMLAQFNPLQPVKLTKVLSLTDTELEDEKLGFFSIEGDFPVYYKDKDSFIFKGGRGIPAGAVNAVLYRTHDQKGRMAVLHGPFIQFDTIRVLLNNSNFTDILHPSLEIACQDGFEVYSIPNRIQITFEKNETAGFRPSEHGIEVWKNGELISVSMFRWPIKSKGKSPLYVKTIYRNQSDQAKGTPYKGVLEVARSKDMLTLVNEIGLEEYLYSVVPSEMPVRFGLEALKVQAVAARAYAARAILASKYRAYGAHLDDSTSSQVYNNISEQDISTHAVNDTAGIVPVYEDQIVDTRFFSTSCGYTANFHEVWSNENNQFPSDKIPYLTANPQYPGNMPDLYKEENFRAFLNQADMPGYDRFSPFFRWNVKMSRQQAEAVLSRNLPEIYKQQPQFILTKTADDSYISKEIPDEIGSLLNVEVLRRGEGGNIMELDITTTHGVFKILKEYNIRQALEPVNLLDGYPVILNCSDGSTRENFPLLPSAFAYIDFSRDKDGNIEEIYIYGGGYGHGVGMSQYGTYGLTLMGKNWQEILAHYYPGSKLVNLYELDHEPNYD